MLLTSPAIILIFGLLCSNPAFSQKIATNSSENSHNYDISHIAKEGDTDVQYWIGRAYHSGAEGYEQNYQLAVEWYTKAAKRGHVKAQFALGTMYQQGWGVKQSDNKAFDWYIKAAEKGDPLAMFVVGSFYSQGRGIMLSTSRAVKWYRQASEHGHAESQFNLANHYFRGEGVAQNEREGMRWLQQSAANGLSSAQYDLGVRYANAKGVNQNLIEAYVWLAIAQKGNHPQAEQALKLLTKYLNSEQLRTAKEEVKNRSLERD